ncbi:heterokaryon incompatibility protein-domain-containing protein [Clohesyomyces aquaticus]|uniref:Heterokaryon incompatibility protein-domain-containing protein n=1 Tax=Clohesyomyces aquaticus TaxID=1231657 RepID=A0A1Y1YSM2_9PLEO|nr:heterokaryon incompatibility protein-domain-containing protein [Clohesyomyces aquaticus]
MAHFKYRPLDTSKNEIRLLFPAIRAGSTARQHIAFECECQYTGEEAFATPDLTMEFELRTVSLDLNPDYTALSYVWGDRSEKRNIAVDGDIFSVTKNLEYLEHRQIRPALWIDAICIDQGSSDEKSSQVPLMARIYSKARRVIVWLGPGSDSTDLTIRMLRQFHNCAWDGHPWCDSSSPFYRRKGFEDLHHHFKRGSVGERFLLALLVPRGHATQQVNANASTASEKFTIDLRHFYHSGKSILYRDWSSRVWTVQEYLLSSACTF